MVHRMIIFTFILAILITMSACFNNERKEERVVCGIKVENCHYNIGKVDTSSGTNLSKHFCYMLYNTTNQTIQFDSVEVSCNCLSVEHSPKFINAYSNDSVVGNINLQGLKGSFSRSLYVNLGTGDVMLLRVVGVVD